MTLVHPLFDVEPTNFVGLAHGDKRDCSAPGVGVAYPQIRMLFYSRQFWRGKIIAYKQNGFAE
jgi:hypothetical protein